MDNYYRLDWPPLGKGNNDIIDEFNNNKTYAGKITSTANNLKKTEYTDGNGYFHLKDWPGREKFIDQLFSDYKINKTFLKNITIQASKGSLPAHTDRLRSLSVIYVLTAPTTTVFYRHKDNIIEPNKIYDKMSIIETERVKFDLCTWYLFNNKNIHSVESTEEIRISLTFDISDLFHSFNEAKENIKNGILFL